MQKEAFRHHLNDLPGLGSRQRCLEHRLMQLGIEHVVATGRAKSACTPWLGQHIGQLAQRQLNPFDQRQALAARLSSLAASSARLRLSNARAEDRLASRVTRHIVSASRRSRSAALPRYFRHRPKRPHEAVAQCRRVQPASASSSASTPAPIKLFQHLPLAKQGLILAPVRLSSYRS